MNNCVQDDFSTPLILSTTSNIGSKIFMICLCNSGNKSNSAIAIKNIANSEIAFAAPVDVGIIFVAMAFRWLLLNKQILSDSNYWGAHSVNTIFYWALCSAALILLVTFVAVPMLNHGEKVENPYLT